LFLKIQAAVARRRRRSGDWEGIGDDLGEWAEYLDAFIITGKIFPLRRLHILQLLAIGL
jgi:hypothetical protein